MIKRRDWWRFIETEEKSKWLRWPGPALALLHRLHILMCFYVQSEDPRFSEFWSANENEAIKYLFLFQGMNLNRDDKCGKTLSVLWILQHFFYFFNISSIKWFFFRQSKMMFFVAASNFPFSKRFSVATDVPCRIALQLKFVRSKFGSP